MQTINLLINNYLIISFIDGKLSANETTQIEKNFVQEYWFYKDILKEGELKKLIIKNILSLKGFTNEDLQKQFLSNTKSLKKTIPINQKLLHIKTLQKLANIENLSASEEKLVKVFCDVLSNSVRKEYPLISLSVDCYKNYIEALIKYCQIDKIAEYERLFLIQEIEMYIKSNNLQEKAEFIYEELLDRVLSQKNIQVGSLFTQDARALFISFNDDQDSYFKKVIMELRDVDAKVTPQERSFDSLFIIAHNSAQRKENKIEEMLNALANDIPSFKITPLKRKKFIQTVEKVVNSSDKLVKLHRAFINMENILCLYFNLQTLDEDEILTLFKKEKLDFQRQLFLNKLLYVKNLDNKHIVDDELYEKFIEHIGSVCFNYYFKIAVKTIEEKKEEFPVFDLRAD